MGINFLSGVTLDSAVLIADTFTPTGGSSGSTAQRTTNENGFVSAAVEVQSTLGGILNARMTNAEMLSLNPADGLQVYNETFHKLYLYENSVWQPINGGGGGGGVSSLTAANGNIVLNPDPITSTGTIGLSPILLGMEQISFPNTTIKDDVFSAFDMRFEGFLLSFHYNVSPIDFFANISLRHGHRITFFPADSLNANSVSLIAGSNTAPFIYTLPITPPASNGQVLSTDTSGNMAWSNAGLGTVTTINTGLNLIGGPITSSGSISLTPTLDNIQQVTFSSGFHIFQNGDIHYATGQIDIVGNTLSLSAFSTHVDFLSDVVINTPNVLRLQSQDSLTFYTGIRAGHASSNVTYTLPDNLPTISGQLLSCTTSGITSWSNASTGTVSSITAGANLTGGTITGVGTIALNTVLTNITSANIGANLYDENGVTATDLYTIAAQSILLNPGAGNISCTKSINLTSASSINFYNAGTTNYVSLTAGNVGGNTAYTLPLTYPSINGQILSSTTAGVMSWISPGSGTVTSITAGANLTGGVITGSGTIALNTVVTGMSSIGFTGGIGLAAGGISSAQAITINSSSTLSITTSGTTLHTQNFRIRAGNSLLLTNAADTFVTGIKSANVAASFTYTLPLNAPSSNGQILSSTTAGVMSWIDNNIVSTAKYILQQPNGSLPNAQSLSALATGVLGNTTTTGVLSIVTSITDDAGNAPYNFFVGIGTGGGAFTTGQYNTGMGIQALTSLSGGNTNTALGFNSGYSITNGFANTLVGAQTGLHLISSFNNTVVGYAAFLNGNTRDNTVMGAESFYYINIDNFVGNSNSAFGSNICNDPNIKTLTNCSFFGARSGTGVNALTNSGAFGVGALVSIDNAINLGFGCKIGINEPNPDSTLHISKVGTEATIYLENGDNPATPVGGGVIFVDGGVLKYRGSSGTVTDIAPA